MYTTLHILVDNRNVIGWRLALIYMRASPSHLLTNNPPFCERFFHVQAFENQDIGMLKLWEVGDLPTNTEEEVYRGLELPSTMSW